MKAVVGMVIPDRCVLEFTQLLRSFDENHEGCTFSDGLGNRPPLRPAPAPQDLRPHARVPNRGFAQVRSRCRLIPRAATPYDLAPATPD